MERVKVRRILFESHKTAVFSLYQSKIGEGNLHIPEIFKSTAKFKRLVEA